MDRRGPGTGALRAERLAAGPDPGRRGRVQIRTVRHSSIGNLTKITVLDPARAIVLEQDLYDGSGHLVAAARTSKQHLDPATGAILPRHIEIDYPSAGFTMKIDIDDLQVNTLGPQNASLWTKPEYAGYPDVNLADPNLFAPPGATAAHAGPPGMPAMPAAAPFTGAAADPRTVPPPNYGPQSYGPQSYPPQSYPPQSYPAQSYPPPATAPLAAAPSPTGASAMPPPAATASGYSYPSGGPSAAPAGYRSARLEPYP